MGELVKTPANAPSIGDINSLVLAIESIATLEEATAATHIVRGITAYAKAQKSLELVNQSMELRIWAERKGGEAIINNKDKLNGLYESHGVSYDTARRWVDLYLLDEAFIRDFISEAMGQSEQIDVKRLISLGRDAARVRVSSGVFRELNGMYTIEWKEGGYKRRKGNYRHKEKAVTDRAQMVRLSSVSTVYRKKESQKSDLGITYSYIRKALDSAGRIPKSELVEQTIEHLYKAEDSFSRAIRRSQETPS